MPDKKFVVVGEHIRSMSKRKDEDPRRYPKDTGKCIDSDCANHYFNSQGKLNWGESVDLIPRPLECGERFSPRVH
jgi:hypothetical protein